MSAVPATTPMGDVPPIPWRSLSGDVAMQQSIANCVYWFHQHIDNRTIEKT